jgi:hypothetical protein
MKNKMPNLRLKVFLAIVGLLAVPSASMAITSTSYEIIDGGTSGYGQHSSTSTSYELVGSLDPMVGYGTSTSYTLDSGSTLHAEYCGDGEINGSESCDGSALNGETCVTQGYDSGTLTCSSSCGFTTSACSTASGGGGGGGSSARTIPSVPTFDDYLTTVLTSSIVLSGARGTDADIYVNETTDYSSYSTSTAWAAEIPLEIGDNTLEIYASNSRGDSAVTTIVITRLAAGAGDATGDGVVNDYDLSILAFYWGTDNSTADFNGDGIVDDYDLSIMAAYWLI